MSPTRRSRLDTPHKYVRMFRLPVTQKLGGGLELLILATLAPQVSRRNHTKAISTLACGKTAIKARPETKSWSSYARAKTHFFVSVRGDAHTKSGRLTLVIAFGWFGVLFGVHLVSKKV